MYIYVECKPSSSEEKETKATKLGVAPLVPLSSSFTIDIPGRASNFYTFMANYPKVQGGPVFTGGAKSRPLGS